MNTPVLKCVDVAYSIFYNISANYEGLLATSEPPVGKNIVRCLTVKDYSQS